MTTRTVHKGYGVHDVFCDNKLIGIVFKNDNGITWQGRCNYKGQNHSMSGIASRAEAASRVSAIYKLIKYG